MREQLTGIRVVRAFVREPIEEERFRGANTDIMVVGRKRRHALRHRCSRCSCSCSTSRSSASSGSARIEVNDGEVQIGTLFAFMQYIGLILGGVLMAAFTTIMIPRAAVSAERIGEVLASESTLTRPENPVTAFPERRIGRVPRCGVRLPRRRVTRCSRGITSGPSPARRSRSSAPPAPARRRSISLIPRLFDATGGSVRVDGVDVREADLDHLWKTHRPRAAASVPLRRHGRIQPAIRSRGGHRRRALARARDRPGPRLRRRRWRAGSTRRIAQGGTNVSGGQRQRLAIARAIVHRPDILVFDDSFSALDLTTDARLRQALWRELPAGHEDRRGAARLDHHRCRPHHRARRRRHGRHRHAR